jgi:hypothetical protein
MVLAVRPEQDPDGRVDRHDTLENRARIGFGVDVVNRIMLARAEQHYPDNLNRPGPMLILNGEDEQFPMMVEVARELGASPGQIVAVRCGPLGMANTKVQFEVLHAEPWLKQIRHLTVVTTGYHVPRVRRTAVAQLPESVRSTVLAVPYKDFPFSVFKIRGELQRIIRYAARGDIAAR